MFLVCLYALARFIDSIGNISFLFIYFERVADYNKSSLNGALMVLIDEVTLHDSLRVSAGAGSGTRSRR